MNSEQYIFNHEEYGEAFIGMARHTSDMTQLDRMIIEDCVSTEYNVLAPHINIKQACCYHLRPEAIQKQIQLKGTDCTFAQAVALCDAWAVIEATPKMVKTFILWINAKGIKAAVEYFEHLAMQLAEVEVLEDDFESMPNHETDPEESDAPPQEFGYHPIGFNDCDEDEKTWEEKQPNWYRRLLANIRRMKNLDQLKAAGKEIFESNKLNHDQAGVFWYEYGKTKERIFKEVRANLGTTARMLMLQIHTKQNKELSSFGILLYRIKSGQVKIANPPSENEWSIIWDTYNIHKSK